MTSFGSVDTVVSINRDSGVRPRDSIVLSSILIIIIQEEEEGIIIMMEWVMIIIKYKKMKFFIPFPIVETFCPAPCNCGRRRRLNKAMASSI